MLPGFRSLFVVLVLATSMLIFGLGAAALLRATHEEFASLPLKPIPELTFGSKEADGSKETEQPTLAVLQVDTSAAEPAAPESKRAEAQHTATPLSEAQAESEADAPTVDALPAAPAADAPATPAGSDSPAALPSPSNPTPATANTTPPADAAAPKSSEPTPGGETSAEADDDAEPVIPKSGAAATDGKTSDATKTMTSAPPPGENFKPPLPSHRPAEAAQAADPSPSTTTKRSSSKASRAAKRHSHHHRHTRRHSHR